MQTNPSRRDVLRMAAVAAGAAATVGLPSLSLAADAGATKKKIPIGLQLYSVRNELKENFEPVIEAVGKMGYVGVEFAGYYGWDKKPKDAPQAARQQRPEMLRHAHRPQDARRG